MDSSLQIINKSNISDDQKLEQEGRCIYQTNSNFKELGNVIANPVFSEYFNSKFQTWEDCQQQIMMLKVCNYLKNKYPNYTPYQIIALLKKVIDNTDTRKVMVLEMMSFMDKALKIKN